ncbi:MAG: hypothetical protein ACRDH5_05945 [bacterium]
MQGARFRIGRSWTGPLIGGVLFATLAAASALGIPKGYPERFEGCGGGDDAQAREKCCTDTGIECSAECESWTEHLSRNTGMTPEELNKYLDECKTDCSSTQAECTKMPEAEQDDSGD